MSQSVLIYNRIKKLRAEQAAVPEGAKNRSDTLHQIQGRLAELDVQLAEALSAEARARGESGAVISGSMFSSPTEQAFGPRSSFTGVGNGFRAAITIPAAPGVADPVVPGFPEYPRGFADTLVQAPTSGAVTFLRRLSKTSAAAQWKTADGAKPESSYRWEEATAPLTWIAHHTPISKTEASDWGQLDAIVRNQLLIGLAHAKSREAIVGDNEAGVTGVVNTEGVQVYDPTTDGQVTDTVYDTIRRMATRVMLVSGFMPTHVAMSPMAKEELDLLKGNDDHYLAINVGTQAWGLQIVQDLGLAITDDEDTVHNGVIVYASMGATWYTKEQDNVEIGLVNDQFISNAYTLLAEGRYALAVKYPDAFCYCEDAIEAVESPS